ncbi:anti-sigma factor family protein [Metabacillus indicus]|uniref:anti-sigma factor family protein n=1 Tax=Metabacillus indicus TaxID=246786 RepID=UPI003CF77B33
MNCETCRDRILLFDQLSEAEQDALLEHIGECDGCSQAFEEYLKLEEALDFVLEDEAVMIPARKKKKPYTYFKRAALICASLFILCLAAWNTPPVKAAIEKALNELIGDKFLEMDKPLEHKESDKESDKEKEKETVPVIYTVKVSPQGKRTISYMSGRKNRQEYENGNYEVSDGTTRLTYYKDDHVYTSEKLDNSISQMTQDIFKGLDSGQIKKLGETTYAGRKADMYEITFDDGMKVEYWFDRETDWILNEFRYEEGIKLPNDDMPKLVEFKVIEAEKDHDLFDAAPPEGAKEIEFDPMRILELEE